MFGTNPPPDRPENWQQPVGHNPPPRPAVTFLSCQIEDGRLFRSRSWDPVFKIHMICMMNKASSKMRDLSGRGLTHLTDEKSRLDFDEILHSALNRHNQQREAEPASRYAVGTILQFKKSSVQRVVSAVRPTGYDAFTKYGPSLFRSDETPDPYMLDGWVAVGVMGLSAEDIRKFRDSATAVEGKEVQGQHAGGLRKWPKEWRDKGIETFVDPGGPDFSPRQYLEWLDDTAKSVLVSPNTKPRGLF